MEHDALAELKGSVCRANLELVTSGLVIQTWGNVSGIDRASGRLVIKPSGVPYGEMKPEQMVVVDLESGRVLEGRMKPSSDTPTHLVLYRAFGEIGSIVHTHSLFATAWAQACREIPAFGTTHADYFSEGIPCTRAMTPSEIQSDYEAHTGHVIVERFATLKAIGCPAVLVAHHGPFAWGASVEEAVHHAVVLEYVARLASETLRVSPAAETMPGVLHEKHFSRKHGPGAYYGQTGAPAPKG